MEQNLTFADLGLSEEILQALEKKGYGYPTRIQAEDSSHIAASHRIWNGALRPVGAAFQPSLVGHACSVAENNRSGHQ